MIGLVESLARPLLRMLDPEDAHRLAILGLKIPPFVKLTADDPRLAVRAFGLDFPNPVGMAAGFDKHGEAPDALLKWRWAPSRPCRSPATRARVSFGSITMKA